MANIEAATLKGNVFRTDVSASDNDLSRYGKHVPVDHCLSEALIRPHILEGDLS